jgi:hypothetical protein
MRIVKVFSVSLAAIAGFSVYPTLHAADNCSGHWTNVGISSETFSIEKGHSVAYFVANGSATSENSADNAVGRCGGYALTMPDGTVKVAGVCVRKTKDGDSWADEWSLEPGAKRGIWKLVQGTGVFAGKKWSGWWEPIVEDGKIGMGKWGGNCN